MKARWKTEAEPIQRLLDIPCTAKQMAQGVVCLEEQLENYRSIVDILTLGIITELGNLYAGL